MMNEFPPSHPLWETAKSLDAKDPLRKFRQEFMIADPDEIYLNGNSLGRLPVRTVQRLERIIREQWGVWLIRGWDRDWLKLLSRVADKLAVIIGAHPGEVLLADSTSVNLYKLAIACLNIQRGKKVVITDELNFPSDLYILRAAVQQAQGNWRLQILSSEDGNTLPLEKIEKAITPEVGLVALSHVCFRSGFLHDISRLSEVIHQHGAMLLVDVSHSAGVVPLRLHDWKVDLAVGCTYKFLNGGPGSPAFLYVREDLAPLLDNPIPGWLGHENPFRFDLEYRPARGIGRFRVGTPPVLAMAAVEPALDLLLEAGQENAYHKAKGLTEFFLSLYDAFLRPRGFGLATPREPDRRGAQISLIHPEAWPISRAARDRKVVLDFRPPNLLRMGFAPLYNSYQELARAVEIFCQIVDSQSYRQYPEGVDGIP